MTVNQFKNKKYEGIEIEESANSLQQLKAEITALANELEMQVGLGHVTGRIELVKRLRQLSAD